MSPAPIACCVAGSPADATAVAHWAEDAGADLLVVAAYSGPAACLALGSGSRRLVHGAPCPTLIVRA